MQFLSTQLTNRDHTCATCRERAGERRQMVLHGFVRDPSATGWFAVMRCPHCGTEARYIQYAGDGRVRILGIGPEE